MSRCLRYRNSAICDHLASQYVVGSITPRVKSRIETLVKTVPELDRAIASWSDDFSELHHYVQAPDVAVKNSEALWGKIDKRISYEDSNQQNNTRSEIKNSTGSFWDQLFVWKLSAGFGALASIILAVLLFTSNPPVPILTTGPDYLANMTIHNDEQQKVQFVISAYAKNEQDPSRLFIQWSKNRSESLKKPSSLHLWAEDRETGELTYIGIQPDEGSQWSLTKPTWKAITSSRRLIMTTDKNITEQNTVFSGECLQLKSWKA